MLVNVQIRRQFKSGNLAGITVYEAFRSDLNMAPKIGSSRTHKPYGLSGMVTDTVLGIEPYATLTTPTGDVLYLS